MDKNAIKKYAIWARNELIAKVSQKAAAYGIEKDNIVDANADSIDGVMLSSVEKKQRNALIEQINEKGYEQVIEEVAYTWFNRFTAIRFMEVNGYLPSHIRVFTDDNNNFKPQILTEAIHLNDVFEKINMEKVLELKQENKTEELYKYLLIIQCNALNDVLPRMFQKIEDYSELLLPDYLLREGSVIERLIAEIPEDNFDVNTEDGQIEIIGWLYQYYISAKHEEVVDPLHGKVVKKEEVPAATQLFTTDWVVRYLIDNSVGRYWAERNQESKLADDLTYFVKPKDGVIKTVDEKITPQDVTVFDPCVGSGHFLVYAFDVLMKIYVEYGYSERDAAAEIVKNNLFGLDIDGRATQLAYFAVVMKARQYDRRFLTKKIQPNVYEITESNNADRASIEYFYSNDAALKKDVEAILDVLKDAKEYGSILQMPEVDFEKINARFTEIDSEISMYKPYLLGDFQTLVRSIEIMSKKYAVVATNPPYLNKYDSNLKDCINSLYKDYSGDLFSVFMYRNFMYCKVDGYSSFMTPFVWMFIQTYEKTREFIVENKAIVSLIQMEYSAYEEATVPICTFVLKNGKQKSDALCFRLSKFKGGMNVQNDKFLEALNNPECGYFYEIDQNKFLKIPGFPIAYWVTDTIIAAFENQLISNIAFSDGQILTGNNNKYLKNLWEVEAPNIENRTKWVLHAKGGEYRRWYGNIDTVVSWSPESIEHYKKDPIARFPKEHILFRKGITWSLISSSDMFGMRLLTPDTTFNKAAATILFNDETLIPYVLGFLNSVVARVILNMLNPTLNTNIKDILALPIIIDEENKNKVSEKVNSCIEISKNDWDSFEISWDFKEHPIVELSKGLWDATATAASMDYYYGELPKTRCPIETCYLLWQGMCNERFKELKNNEEELNRIFIQIYGVQDELSPEIDDKDVTVRKADLQRDIRSLISYAVGCMFGRYSVDTPGLIYAGGDWDETKYNLFKPDADAIIPICDDEYFEDDIVGRFISFIETIFGKDSLEDNLRYIAEALGGKGSSREVIRNYFLNDFYSDHVKIYQKRPIYWLFDSGRKNGFKCLVYMHRYKSDTIARIRTDYVHEQQARYRTAIVDLEKKIDNSTTSERARLNKRFSILKAQDEELRLYEEKVHHLADQMIEIDLDDGVKVNYAKFQDVLAKIK